MNVRNTAHISAGEQPLLIQTLLNTASPRTAQYLGHAMRTDCTCGVVVSTSAGFKTITLPARALELMADGIVVDQDRDYIRRQLGQA